ncbi:phosphoadenosine phosphosulfate reductase family protein [Desulfosporosinus sp.]|uniref:phosphoadenosine phosphosulfate reductase domain-containing protein n=1 Tax=Desulfosporosinus sp. TaxID=157907 RepID=UPI0025C1F029|nr:phosphoadenosine phosphosulfate reductase family protein [Desulfosporosinus sp.]MBC2726976.1 phosphoadenosine phosphosulfate reductase family protein [Desulfosporosinus sp.]
MRLYWCGECNIPVYKTTCPLCDSKTNYFAMDARPVFPEEVTLLEILLHKKGRLHGRSIWNAKGNRYYADGNLLRDFSVQEITREWDPDQVHRLFSEEKNKGFDYDSFNTMISKFILANKKHLQKLEYDSFEFIKMASEKYNNRINMVSFSGGKDSTVVSSLVRRALGAADILHIFGNTTLEFPTTYDYVEQFQKFNRRVPFFKPKSERDFFELSETIGPPSRVMRWCCTVFKTGPIADIIDKLSIDELSIDGIKKDNKILTFYGIRRSESTQRSKYEAISKSPKIAKQIVASPIIDWIDADVWLYLLSHDEVFNYAYRLGFSRVGCLVCPNNSDWAYFLNKVHFPEQATRWRDFLVSFASKIGKPDAEEYIDSGNWKARQGGNGMEVGFSKVKFEPCATETNARNYTLTRPITRDLYEYFKPFGNLDFERGRPLLGEVYVWTRKDKKKEKPLLRLQGKIGQSHLKIIIDPKVFHKEYPRKSLILLDNWIDCQLRKYQACIACGGCPAICKMKAITLIDERYRIDSSKCIGCMECIAHYDKGCLVTKVTQTRRVI